MQNQWGRMKRKQIWREWRSKGVSEHLLTILSDWLGLKYQCASESQFLIQKPGSRLRSCISSKHQGGAGATHPGTTLEEPLAQTNGLGYLAWILRWVVWEPVSRKSFCARPLCYCPGGCWSPPASMVTSSQPSCNEPLPPYHLGGNVHQVFLLTPGHREDAWSKPWRGLAILLDQQRGVAGKPGAGGAVGWGVGWRLNWFLLRDEHKNVVP